MSDSVSFLCPKLQSMFIIFKGTWLYHCGYGKRKFIGYFKYISLSSTLYQVFLQVISALLFFQDREKLLFQPSWHYLFIDRISWHVRENSVNLIQLILFGDLCKLKLHVLFGIFILSKQINDKHVIYIIMITHYITINTY